MIPKKTVWLLSLLGIFPIEILWGATTSNSPEQKESAVEPANSLEKNSPFIPSGFGGRPGVSLGGGQDLEFRGVLRLNNNILFSLFHKPTNKSSWVDYRDPHASYFIKEYSPTDQKITVENNGQVYNLALITPSEKAGASTIGMTGIGGPGFQAGGRMPPSGRGSDSWAGGDDLWDDDEDTYERPASQYGSDSRRYPSSTRYPAQNSARWRNQGYGYSDRGVTGRGGRAAPAAYDYFGDE